MAVTTIKKFFQSTTALNTSYSCTYAKAVWNDRKNTIAINISTRL